MCVITCLTAAFVLVFTLAETSFAEEGASAVAASDTVATVLGEPVLREALIDPSMEHHRKTLPPEAFAKTQRDSRGKLLVKKIGGPLLDAYAKREGLIATERDTKPYLDQMMRTTQETADRTGVDPNDPVLRQQTLEFFVKPIVQSALIQRSLWRKHGGTVGFGSLGGCVAFEAQHAFLEGEVEAGRLAFPAPDIEQAFWLAVMNKRLLADVVVEESEEIERYFALYLAPPEDD